MRHFPRIFMAAVSLFAAMLFLQIAAMASDSTGRDEANGLPLSDMGVSISAAGQTATFRLYDTDAAKGFYEQLPLSLPLSNFRDAQWMFYPPEKLKVLPGEAYHDGVKGELSYYEPWGDVFMLYKDFYARDEMHRLGIGLTGIDGIEAMTGDAVIRKVDLNALGKETAMRITVTSNDLVVVYELNDSGASKDLLAQLPLRIKVENYGGIEKIFYPPTKLQTADTPLAKDIEAGTLAYYAPWGDVVMFYDAFRPAAGLFELGRALSGDAHIRDLSGDILVEIAE